LKAARTEGKRRVADSAATRVVLRALTGAMKLDLLLFGRIESGPFFALLERMPPASSVQPPASNLQPPTSNLPPPASSLQ